MLSVVTSTRDTWQELGFNDFQKLLETTALELATNRDEGDKSRSILVQLTREFRKNASEEARKQVSALLKSFQSEVDASRKRCSFAEESFINIYKKLIDLPDPTLALCEAQTLQKKAQKVSELEYEVRVLKESSEHLKTELSEMKHHEYEHSRLQRTVEELTRNADAQLKERCIRSEESSKQLVLEKEQEMIVLRAEMDAKSQTMEEKSRTLTKALELAQSEIFKLKSRADASDTGKSSELEILVDELEKANARVKDLESRLSSCADRAPESDELNRQIVSLQTLVEEFESDLKQKEAEVNTHLSTIQELRESNNESTKHLDTEQKHWQAIVAAMETKLTSLHSQLDAQSDYAEVCRELQFLRSIEFPEAQPSELLSVRGEPEGLADSNTTAADISSDGGVRQSLEALLMNKNRHLQNQLAEASSVNDQLSAELHRLQLYETESKQQAQEQRELIALLESDLYRMQEAFEESQRQSTGPPQQQSTGQLQSHTAMEGLLSTEAIGEEEQGANKMVTAAAVPSRIDPSLLHIVEHQRDRFRARADELEQSETNLRQQLVTVQRDCQSVRADNVKLYEKIRFLQSYSSPVCGPRASVQANDRTTIIATANEKSTTSGQRAIMDGTYPTGSSSSTSIPMQSSDPLVQKYSQAYEASLDPFSQFGRQERQRRYQHLRPHEKIMLKVFHVASGNRSARLGVFIYAIMMHVLIFLALYKAAYFQTTAAEAEASCIQRYAEHMQSVHHKTN